MCLYLPDLESLSLIHVTLSPSPETLDFPFQLAHFETDFHGMAPQVFEALVRPALSSLELVSYEHKWLCLNYGHALETLAPALETLAFYFFDFSDHGAFNPTHLTPFLSKLHNLRILRCYARHGKILDLLPPGVQLELWEPQTFTSDAGEMRSDLEYLLLPGGPISSGRVSHIRVTFREGMDEEEELEPVERECRRRTIGFDCLPAPKGRRRY